MEKEKEEEPDAALALGLGSAYFIWFHFCPKGHRGKCCFYLHPEAPLVIAPSWAQGKFYNTSLEAL